MKIEATSGTPSFLLNHDKGIITIEGRSVSEDITQFYNHVQSIIDDYTKTNKINIIEFHLDYINTKSQRYLIDILKKLQTNPELVLNWNCDEDDLDMIEVGEIFNSILSFQINIHK